MITGMNSSDLARTVFWSLVGFLVLGGLVSVAVAVLADNAAARAGAWVRAGICAGAVLLVVAIRWAIVLLLD